MCVFLKKLTVLGIGVNGVSAPESALLFRFHGGTVKCREIGTELQMLCWQ